MPAVNPADVPDGRRRWTEGARCPRSYVIPVLNEAAGIADQLRTLRRLDPAAELVVVDGGSGDGTPALAQPLCDRLLHSAPGRAGQMNAGADVARGNYLCFLHADTLPRFDGVAFDTALAGGPRWGFCRVRLSGGHRGFRVIESAMNLRSRLTRVATGDQMLFVGRELFRQSGGFADIPLMEDVDYCKRLRRLARPLMLAETVLTSSRRWEEQGIALTVIRMWALRLAWFLGASPERLWQHYYGGSR